MPTLWLKGILFALTALIVAVSPPVISFAASPALGWLAFGVCAALALWPGKMRMAAVAHAIAEVGAWLLLMWCVLSQVASLLLPDAVVLGTRLLTVAVVLLPWLWLRLAAPWQRRTMVAIALPGILTLGTLIATSPPRPLAFRPQYVAASVNGYVYITDHESPVIRVFRPDGSLVGKLRPGLASVQGPPGPGMYPTGPYNDPDRLGIARATGPRLTRVALQPWPTGTDDFWFSGLALDNTGTLIVPDWMRERLLRFSPGGRLLSAAPLPAGFTPTLGCVAWGNGGVYLADDHGEVLRLDPLTGAVLRTWVLPGPATGGIAWDARTGGLVALGVRQVYELDLSSGNVTSFYLPPPASQLAHPYESLAVGADGSIVVADLGSRTILIYNATGMLMRTLSSAPDGFAQATTVATDGAGSIYVADTDLRAVQRFDARDRQIGLYRAADDDEKD